MLVILTLTHVILLWLKVEHVATEFEDEHNILRRLLKGLNEVQIIFLDFS